MNKTIIAIIGAIIIIVAAVVAIEVFGVLAPNVSPSSQSTSGSPSGQSGPFAGETNVAQILATANSLSSKIKTLNISYQYINPIQILLQNGSNIKGSDGSYNFSISIYSGRLRAAESASRNFAQILTGLQLPSSFSNIDIRSIAFSNGTANITCSNSWVIHLIVLNQSVANENAVNCTYVPSPPPSLSSLFTNFSSSMLYASTLGEATLGGLQSSINNSVKFDNLGITTIDGQQCTMFKYTSNSSIVLHFCFSDSIGVPTFFNTSVFNSSASINGSTIKTASILTSLIGTAPTAASISSLPPDYFGNITLSKY